MTNIRQRKRNNNISSSSHLSITSSEKTIEGTKIENVRISSFSTPRTNCEIKNPNLGKVK
ncbi:hypothetical protein DERP_012133 [Dermatophagoides pteronyssinus]|uniref:Uncharacterized protein n=1 Tax=Dermatophagoides pteronyssinus TaxID=6956 RepID=A0ABQ8J2B5_DERPT|nr:hypothetical protein DERP_012133 [Dermatophagoides pteronyssinus]